MFMKKRIVLMLVLSLFFTGAGFAGFLETPHLASGLQIRPDNRYFDVLPRIVPADQESTVSFVPLFDHVKFTDNAIYELTYTPMEFEPVKGGPVGGTARRGALVDYLAHVTEQLERLSDAVRNLHFESGPPAVPLSELSLIEVMEGRA